MNKMFLRHFSMVATGFSLLSIPPVFADVQIGAKLLWDHSYYNGVHHSAGKSGSDNEIRLVRVYMKSKFDEHWESMIQTQITEHEGSTKTAWKEVFLKYNGLGPFDLTFGKRKEPFGLQMLVNAERVLFLERTMISSAFAPSSGNSSYSKGGPEADNSEKDTYAVTGRVTFAPLRTENSLIHLGLAGSYRDFGGNEFQVKDRAEVHLAQQIEGAQDAKHDGYYAELGFLINGTRGYKNGKFGAVTPSSPYGAWQLMGRYSVLNAEDNNEGVQAENIGLGLNWFANKSVRISANYILTQLDNAEPDNDDGDAFTIRFQYVF